MKESRPLAHILLRFLRRLLLKRKHCLHEDSALEAFLLDRTADLIRVPDIPVKEICVRVTAAAAVEPRPAVTAQRLVQHM